MADLRLLTLTTALAVAIGGGCDRLPETLDLPEVRGHVVDAETGEPVAGAEVFTNLDLDATALLAKGSVKLGTRYQTSDAKGEFHFPPATVSVPAQFRRHWRLAERPSVYAFHRDHGWDGAVPTEDEGEFTAIVAMKRDRYLIRKIAEDPNWGTVAAVCGRLSNAQYENQGDSAYFHCCDVLYSPESPLCHRPGPRNPAVIREMREAYGR